MTTPEKTPADLLVILVEKVRAARAELEEAAAYIGPFRDLLSALDALDRALAEEAGGQGEPGHWEPGTWGQVRDGDRVRLGDQEADVVTVVRLDWHVDPRSPDRYPRPLETSSVQVVLAGKNDGRPYTMPPSGPVEIWRPSLPDWAAQAYLTLADAGLTKG